MLEYEEKKFLPHPVSASEIFLNWNSLHTTLNSHYVAWSYKKKKYKKAYRKSVQKKPTIKRSLVILDLKAIQIMVQRKAFYRQIILESSGASKENVRIGIRVTSRYITRKIMQTVRISSRPPPRIRKWNQLSQFSCEIVFLLVFISLFVPFGVCVNVQYLIDTVRNQTLMREYLLELSKRRSKVH